MQYMAEMSTARQEWLIKRQGKKSKNKAIEGWNDAVAGLVKRKVGKGL